MDNSLADALLSRGAVTPEFVAAALAIDLRNPVLSKKRADLLKFMPDTYHYKPLPDNANPLAMQRHPDALTTQVIASIGAANPAPGTGPREFLELLQSGNPKEVLRQRIVAYRQDLDSKLNDSGDATRQSEWDRLYEVAIERRNDLLADRKLGVLDETGGRLLFPSTCP